MVSLNYQTMSLVSPDNLKSFIKKNFENPVCPTRAQYLEKIKINQQIEDFTTDFNVKNFLQLFSNPVEHFEKSDRKCAISQCQMSY